MDSLGYIHRHLGRYDSAIDCYERAVDAFDELGNRYQLADTLDSLGDTYAAAGEPDRARAAWRRAATMLDELGVLTARSDLIRQRATTSR